MARRPGTGDAQPDGDLFLRFATAVGDLRNPFYEEERQRDVWNEASAVGFQVVLWLGLAAATAMVWIGRADALPYACTTLGVVGLGAVVAIGYAKRLGVDVEQPERMRRPAMIPVLGLMVALVAGTALAWDGPSDGLMGGMRDGATIGGAIGGAAAVIGLVWQVTRRRDKADEGPSDLA